MPDSSIQRPDVFSYNNYREFLRDLYQYHKRYSEGFSYRHFSAQAGFKSPNVLKLVIDGQRNLTPRSSAKMARGFRLDEEQIGFFRQLVLLNQAKSPHEKRKHTSELLKIETFKKLHPLKVAEYDLYRHWHFVAIREMIAAPGFQEDPQWISDRLPGVSREEVSISLENLLKLGLIARDEHGRLRQGQKNITTGHEVNSATIADFHRQMIDLGAASIDAFKRYEREISASTLLLSEDSFQKIKTLLQEFRRSLLVIADEDQGNRKAVYQFNFQAFPLSEFIGQIEDAEGKKSA